MAAKNDAGDAMGGDKRWRLRIAGMETGPMTLATVRGLVQRGEAGPNTPVCEEESSLWTELVLVPALRALLSNTSPPGATSAPPIIEATPAEPDKPPATLDDVLAELRVLRRVGKDLHYRLGWVLFWIVLPWVLAFVFWPR